jgi:hypothetical protein
MSPAAAINGASAEAAIKAISPITPASRPVPSGKRSSSVPQATADGARWSWCERYRSAARLSMDAFDSAARACAEVTRGVTTSLHAVVALTERNTTALTELTAGYAATARIALGK